MKTNWTKLFLFFSLIINHAVHAVPQVVSDTLVHKRDTLPSKYEILHKDIDPVSGVGHFVVTDTVSKAVYVLSDSLALDELLGDTVCLDSLGMPRDSILADSLMNDSLVLDSLAVDTLSVDTLSVDTLSIDTLAVDSLAADTLRTDSLIVKKDTVKVQPVKVVIPESVKKLNRIYADFRKASEADQDRWDDIYLSLSEIEMNPAFYKYVIPLTYYSRSIEEASTLEGWAPEDVLTADSIRKEKMVMKGAPRVDGNVQLDKKINRQLLGFYVEYPQLVYVNEARIDSLEVLKFDKMSYSAHDDDIISLIQNNAGIGQMEESDLLVVKPNFWTMGGTGFLQFSQNYISDNWYKGGESTKSLLSGFTYQIKYDDKQKLQYEGKFEWKLGFITNPNDTVHSYKANNDLLRLSSKLGYKAISNWYYTLSAEFQTQLTSNYESNSDKLISSFFSPATLNVGLGMDYKYVKDGTVNLSVLVNPINYTLYSVASDKVDPTKFNIKEGHKKEHEWGSRINATLTWKMFKFLMWESKFSYTTNYEKVFSEWENTFTFVINKYLSTKLFVHGRYDDSVKPEEGEGYLQLQELLSFGLNYTW